MKQFNDSTGRAWDLSVNVTSIKRVRDLLKFDLLGIVEGKLVDRLLSDQELLVNIVFVLCKPQAEKLNVTDEAFGEAMADGDVIQSATDALLQDLTDFFRPGRREAMQLALAKVQEAEQQAFNRARQQVAAIDVASLMPLPSGDSSTSKPASAV